MKVSLALPVFASLFIMACNNSPKTEKTDDNITAERNEEGEGMIQKGAYLVTVAGCNDCHTPKIFTAQGPVPDSTKRLSGHPAGEKLPPINLTALKPGQWMQAAPDLTAWVGPWGISYTANLTSDSATGTGAWTEDVFIKTIRTGKHLGAADGRQILPPMPWQEFAKLKDDDLKAIFVYLHSLPPVSNRVPAPVPPNEVAAMKQ